MVKHKPAIYIMTNKPDGVLYTGVTNNLMEKVYMHKFVDTSGFARYYDCKYLVYYEHYENMLDAIARGKKIKAGTRKNKLALIESMNPTWQDLFEIRG